VGVARDTIFSLFATAGSDKMECLLVGACPALRASADKLYALVMVVLALSSFLSEYPLYLSSRRVMMSGSHSSSRNIALKVLAVNRIPLLDKALWISSSVASAGITRASRFALHISATIDFIRRLFCVFSNDRQNKLDVQLEVLVLGRNF
jgi:hypothetical protein